MQENNSVIAEISNSVTKNRKRLMGFGILSLILGIIGTYMSTVVTMSSIFMLGVFVIFGGLMFAVESFSAPKHKGRFFNILIAILYVFAGVSMLVDPLGSAVWFTLFIALFLIVVGVLRILSSIQMKNEMSAWGWILFGGVINMVLGILILSEWPISGLWVIGLFISIELIMQGFNAIILSQTVKTVQKDISEELQ